jgi:hypothetical protein
MRRVRRLVVAGALAFATVVAAVTPASAEGRPTMTVTPIHGTYPRDRFTSAKCGFTVSTTVWGQVRFWTFPEGSQKLVELETLNIHASLSANGNTVKWVDAGSSTVYTTADGSTMVTTNGHWYYYGIGRLVINITTGEVTFQAGQDVDYAALCAALAA